MSDYKQTVSLKHNETLAKIDVETGEVIGIVPKYRNNIPEGKEFAFDESWTKSYEKSWLYLADTLKPHELKIAVKMAAMTEFSTNSLAPLDDKMQLNHMSEMFGVGVNQIKKSLTTLLKVGVYATFTYGHYQRGVVTEWVFNPFISFKGKLVNSDLKNLFINTPVAQHFYN